MSISGICFITLTMTLYNKPIDINVNQLDFIVSETERLIPRPAMIYVGGVSYKVEETREEILEIINEECINDNSN